MYDYEKYDMIRKNQVSAVVHKRHLILLDYRFLHHLKGKVGNEVRVEPSICYAYLVEEITNFIANYFDDSVNVKTRDLPRNVINIDRDKSDAIFLNFSPVTLDMPRMRALCEPWIIWIIEWRMHMCHRIVGW